MWGSNAREAHPIFFHHVLKGIRNGAKMYAVDPRRSSTAQWADAWLGIHVGSDISLANAIANEIITAGLVNEEFIRRATVNFEAYARKVSEYPLERAERDTGVPADLIRQLAHDYARADRAQICWTLGITEHHNAADNVLALINLSLLTGHVGRYGSGLVPLQRPEQRPGRRRHGRHPEQADRLPGHRDQRGRPPPVRREVRRHDQSEEGHAPVADVRGDGRGRAHHRLRHRREPAALRGGHLPHPQAPRGPGVPGGAGHLPDRHRQGGARGAARHGLLVRVRGHRHQQRAPRAAGPQGDRPAAWRPRRHRDHHRAGRGGSAPTGATPPPRISGTSCARCRPCTAA